LSEVIIAKVLRRWWAQLLPASGTEPSAKRHALGTVLLTIGAALVFATVAAYGWMAIAQHHLASQWRARNARASASVPISSDGNKNGITLLVVPKIKLQAAILDGTDRMSLLLAPGHVQHTAWPGDPGNAAIAAHRDSFFRQLDELNLGDGISVHRGGSTYEYVVSGKSIVAPDDLAVLAPTNDTRLTLITCYPTVYIGPAPKRLVIVAELRSDRQHRATPSTVAGAP
jgi:sortase A